MDKRKNDTKERIIQSVINDISQNGYDSISLRDVAKKHNITATALYKHFQGKDDLMNTVLAEVSHIVYELYRTRKKDIGINTTTKDDLLIIGKSILNMFAEKPLLMDFLFFSPYALSTYQDMEDLNTPFSLLKEYKLLIGQFVVEYNLATDAKTLLIKLWSFMQGYSLLVTNKIVDYDEKLLESTLNDIISQEGVINEKNDCHKR